jgi:hypothetical protein
LLHLHLHLLLLLHLPLPVFSRHSERSEEPQSTPLTTTARTFPPTSD